MLDKYHKKEKPILGLAGMGGGTSSRLFGAVAFIDAPSITSPSASSTVDINGFTITSSTATGEGFGTHTQTDWQIAEDSGFSTIYEQSLADTSNLTSFTTTTQFDGSKTLYLRVRYRSDLGVESDYSNTIQVSAVQMYFWRIDFTINGYQGGGGTGGGDDESGSAGGRGGRGTGRFETSSTTQNAPGTAALVFPYGSGGSGSTHSSGGASTAAKIGSTVVMVAGGGGSGTGDTNPPGGGSGGGAGLAGGNGGVNNNNQGTAGSGGAAGNSSAGNGSSGGAGGGAGGNGGGAGSGRGSAGGGGGYKVADSTVVGDFTTISISGSNGQQQGSGNGTITLYRKYKTGSWVQQQSHTSSSTVTLSTLQN